MGDGGAEAPRGRLFYGYCVTFDVVGRRFNAGAFEVTENVNVNNRAANVLCGITKVFLFI